MGKRSVDRKLKVVIAGAGPAGSSLAIRLAGQKHDVTLVERDVFPRHKLCGEFISPECLRHFRELGADEAILQAGGERIYETRFYDRRGRSFTVPTSMLDEQAAALSLSRAEMDLRLLERAKACGVSVIEGASVTRAEVSEGRLRSIVVQGSDEPLEADLFVDATGRNRALTRLVERSLSRPRSGAERKPVAVGYKAHFRLSKRTPGVCEIFSFPGGYGGLSPIEDGLSNLCFLVTPQAARRFGPAADDLVAATVVRNEKAALSLAGSERSAEWLAVSVTSFGRASSSPLNNLVEVGDASAFIDPFTGSGMLMALESSALLADAVAAHGSDISALRSQYLRRYDAAFAQRLRICSILRQAAFVPVIPTAAIVFLNLSRAGREFVAASTRGPKRAKIV